MAMWEAGARSSVDESRSDGPEDETTVVEPDQGNGEFPYILSSIYTTGAHADMGWD